MQITAMGQKYFDVIFVTCTPLPLLVYLYKEQNCHLNFLEFESFLEIALPHPLKVFVCY